jgi:hypothetical protein
VQRIAGLAHRAERALEQLRPGARILRKTGAIGDLAGEFLDPVQVLLGAVDEALGRGIGALAQLAAEQVAEALSERTGRALRELLRAFGHRIPPLLVQRLPILETTLRALGHVRPPETRSRC